MYFNTAFVYGIGHRKDILQRYYEKLNKIIEMLNDYVDKIDTCGEHRNSYSKTNFDGNIYENENGLYG